MSLITISHGIGSEGEAIARRAAAGLDIELFDDARLKQEALRMGIRAEDLKGLDEKSPGFFERMLSRKPEVYLELMKAVVYEVAGRGAGVIAGHGSQVLLQEFDCALHVLVQTSRSSRIETLSRQMGLSREAAGKLIDKSDHEREGFFQFAFQKRWNDPALYDLCINPQKLGVEQAGKIIVETARAPVLQSCSLNALDTMERLSQVKRVEAALCARDIPMALLRVEVPQKGVATVMGLVFSPDDQAAIAEALKGIDGLEEARIDVSVMRGGYV
jgi:cytidylate kinase